MAVRWNIGPNQPVKDEKTGERFVTCWDEIDGRGSDGGHTFPAGKGYNRLVENVRNSVVGRLPGAVQ